MKKLLVGITAISLVLALIVPAMADLNVDFSGEYRIRGFYNDNPWLTKGVNGYDDGYSASWLDHRFRLKTVFQANENVSVTTRLDIFDDQPFGDENVLTDGNNSGFTDTFYSDGNDIDVDEVYLTALTSIGLFKAGRIAGGSSWGTDLGNTGEDFSFDRIEYFMKTGDIIGGVIYEKLYEDNTLGNNNNQGDIDTYYLLGQYKQEDFEAGVCFRYQDVDDLFDLAAAASPELYYVALSENNGVVPIMAIISGYDTVKNYALAPYVKAAFGPVGIEAEAIYETGKYEGSAPTRDIDTLTWTLEGSVDMDAASAHLGWAACSGQDYGELVKSNGDLTIGNLIYRGLGWDFEPLLILTGDAGGKPLNNGYTTLLTGVKLVYAGGSFAISDTLSLNGAIGQAWVDEDRYTNGDDDLGWEVDLGLTWQVMDNLTYSAGVGYLDKGDEILRGTALSTNASYPFAGTDGDDTYVCVHEVKVEF